MASTPWGIAAEDAWNRANLMRQEAEASESYNMRCLFCKQKVFLVPDEMSRMPGHIYSPAGGQEYANTRICEFCYDKTADAMDGVPRGFFVKRYPQNSEMAWRYQTRADLDYLPAHGGMGMPDLVILDDDPVPEDSDYEWRRY